MLRLITAEKTKGAKTMSNETSPSAESLLAELEQIRREFGEHSKEAGTCLYQLGLLFIRQANAMDAMKYLGDALYIRRMHYPEEDLKIREIYYALEQCTFM